MALRGHRTAIALAACSLTVSALLTACGGSDDEGADAEATTTAGDPSPGTEPAEDDPEDEAPAEDEPEAPAPDTLTETQLAQALLTQGDLAEFRFDEVPVTHRDGTTAEPAACQPLENVRLFALDPAPVALAGTLATGTSGDAAGTATTVILAAYDLADAEQIMADLETAVADCAEGFDGGALRFTSVTPTTPPDLADDRVAFELLGDGTQPGWYTVIRTGSTLALFHTATGTDASAAVPDPLVVQQFMKIQAASQT
ncbi:hypothetical protein [Streptomyces specialis]|uniref:hypothetical protein n=1 Tax=Streptomyces specialis TaxID=498367 RepID=UPI00073F5B0F|nr:hypothetical protein [Streptomyces specialis]